MFHLCACTLRLEVRRFQLEIPLGGAVGVVDQHEVWIVLQTLRLVFHRLAILLDEFGKNKFQE